MIYLAENLWLYLFYALAVDYLCHSRSEATVAVQLFSEIRITKSQFFWGLFVGFYVAMIFIAAAYAATPVAQAMILAALICTIPLLIIFGGKAADLLDDLLKLQIKPSRSLIFKKQKERANPRIIVVFRSTTFFPSTPPTSTQPRLKTVIDAPPGIDTYHSRGLASRNRPFADAAPLIEWSCHGSN
ncbi:MAG: hypothetical protein KGL63_04400 [Betaproteobacteria bacterium]|nr:hypothetical protein [Betaproteobacteria bacterium]